MNEADGRQLLRIKKYPNRRYYDTTRSCHVTLQEIQNLVVSGKDVCIADSRTGDDITNLVLMQIILEKDQPKLDIFPSSIPHLMIRSNRQVLRGYVDQFFTPFLSMLARSQKQFDAYMRRATAGRFVTPMDWANSMLEALGATGANEATEAEVPSPDEAPDSSTVASVAGEDADELRTQLAELQRRIENLSSGPAADEDAD